MVNARRLVVFTSNLSWSVCAGIAAVAHAEPDTEWLVVVHAPPRRPLELLRNQWRNIRRNGLRWIAYQASELAHRLFRGTPLRLTPGMPGYDRTLQAIGNRVDVKHVADIHAPETLDAVRAFAPALGLSLAAPILRKP